MAKMGRPKLTASERREREIKVKLTIKEWHRLRLLSRLYADGDLSKWVRHGALNAPRRKLK